jgi:hypothetical protein
MDGRGLQFPSLTALSPWNTYLAFYRTTGFSGTLKKTWMAPRHPTHPGRWSAVAAG